MEEHRAKGGDIEADVACQWLKYFEHDDKKLAEIYGKYSKGELLSGEVKTILIEKINEILSKHQKRRRTSGKQLDKFIYKN